jgi:multisubunit Na+/H+ antiporter MnhB subunit
MAAEPRVWTRANWGIGSIFILVALILFVLAIFDVKIAEHGLIAPGLAFFALGHLL